MVKEIIAKSKKQGNKIVLVDDEDYERLSEHLWYVYKGRHTFYAVRDKPVEGKRKTQVSMHREIMGFPSSNVDHKDQNGLNNQKSNLRLATTKQNTVNSKVYKNNKSGFKGVSWCKINKRWRVQLSCKNIGWYDSKEEAARAYDKAALEKFGEFATLNYAPSS